MKNKKSKGRKGLESHKVVLRKMSENVGKSALSKAMRKQGYSESYIKSGHIKNTKSWQNLLDTALPDGMLLEAHRELIKHEEWRARDAGLEKAYKLKKRYKDELTVNHQFADLSDREIEERITQILAGGMKLVLK